MDKISEYGCIVCRENFNCITPAEIHHIDGKTKLNAHLMSLPLCYKHHREGANNESYVSRHPFKKEFEKRYGKQTDLLKRLQDIIYDNS